MRQILKLLVLFLTVSSGLVASPLHIAVQSLDMELFKLKIEKVKTDKLIDATDKNGMTALHYACKLSIIEMVTALIKNGANPSIKSNDGKNALHHAVCISTLCLGNDHSETDLTICPLTIPELLASAGVDINALDNSGNAPIHLAAQNGLVGVIAVLIKTGADPNHKNKNGDTPLHLVGGMLAPVAAQVLLVKGANPNIKNNQGLRPIDIAVKKNIPSLINMINKYAHKKN